MAWIEAEIGIIGGSGFYSFAEDAEPVFVSTPYGAPTSPISIGTVGDRRVAFVARHGAKHEYPPHLVNYRANLWAFRSLGVRQVLAPCAVGSLRPDLPAGTIVVPDQLVDRTWGRAHTLFDQVACVAHVSFADPYCPRGRAAVLASGRDLSSADLSSADLSSADLSSADLSGADLSGADLIDGGTLAVVNGPRFSTRAESAWHAAQGWSLVGMTGQPEASLARELALCYTCVALVTDLDAGVEGDSPVSHREVLEIFEANLARLKDLLRRVVVALPPAEPDDEAGCACRRSLDGLTLPFELP